jgi:predicted dehydrogenase
MINIGLIGYGHWGPDHARIFNGQVDSLVVAVADPDERRLAAAQDQIPFVSATSDHRILLDHPEVTTVVIATPLRTHFGLTREALLADKGVLDGEAALFHGAGGPGVLRPCLPGDEPRSG